MAEIPQDQADQVRAALRAIVSDPDYGVAALSNPQMMPNLLRDYLPDAPLQKNLLVAAAEDGVADRLRDNAVPGADINAVVRSIEIWFRSRRGLTEDASSWVVRELSIALGLGSAEKAAAEAGRDDTVTGPTVSPLASSAADGSVASSAVDPTVPAPWTSAGSPGLESSPVTASALGRRPLAVILAVLGALFAILGVIYFADPGSLPLVFFGPHEAISRPGSARGGVALGVGALVLAGAWLTNRSRFSLADAASRRLILAILAALWVLFVVLGVLYLAYPGVLPLVFFRAHEAIRKPHPIRGGVALGLAVLALAGAWLFSRAKRLAVGKQEPYDGGDAAVG